MHRSTLTQWKNVHVKLSKKVWFQRNFFAHTLLCFLLNVLIFLFFHLNLCVEGELIGGLDIVRDMARENELKDILPKSSEKSTEERIKVVHLCAEKKNKGCWYFIYCRRFEITHYLFFRCCSFFELHLIVVLHSASAPERERSMETCYKFDNTRLFVTTQQHSTRKQTLLECTRNQNPKKTKVILSRRPKKFLKQT